MAIVLSNPTPLAGIDEAAEKGVRRMANAAVAAAMTTAMVEAFIGIERARIIFRRRARFLCNRSCFRCCCC